MTTPITFWFDFTSPYAYFALDAVERLAHSHGRALIWRPILLWAVLKAQKVPRLPGAPISSPIWCVRRLSMAFRTGHRRDFHYQAPRRACVLRA
jgi:2-hydroxychromene-2-carboxylate isomerase